MHPPTPPKPRMTSFRLLWGLETSTRVKRCVDVTKNLLKVGYKARLAVWVPQLALTPVAGTAFHLARVMSRCATCRASCELESHARLVAHS